MTIPIIIAIAVNNPYFRCSICFLSDGIKINEIYRQKNSIKRTNIDIRYSNDLTLYLLALQLDKYDISFLNIEEKDCDFDYFLDVKSSNNIFLDAYKNSDYFKQLALKCEETKDEPIVEFLSSFYVINIIVLFFYFIIIWIGNYIK